MTIPVNLQIFPIGKANRSPHRALDAEGTLGQPQSVSQSSQDVVFHRLGLLCGAEQANREAATDLGGKQVHHSKGCRQCPPHTSQALCLLTCLHMHELVHRLCFKALRSPRRG